VLGVLSVCVTPCSLVDTHFRPVYIVTGPTERTLGQYIYSQDLLNALYASISTHRTY
jgi:hypothetical protein